MQQAAMQAASLAAQSGSSVKVFSMSGDGRPREQVASVDLVGQTPHKLFGGPVLSIATKKIISRGDKILLAF